MPERAAREQRAAALVIDFFARANPLFAAGRIEQSSPRCSADRIPQLRDGITYLFIVDLSATRSCRGCAASKIGHG